MSGEAIPLPVWRMPVVLAGLILFGLLDALLIDDEIARFAAWIALTIPPGVALGCAIGAYRRVPTMK